MVSGRKVLTLLLVAGCGFPIARAQVSRASGKKSEPAAPLSAKKAASRPAVPASRLLSVDDGLAVIAAALESRSKRSSEADCSHLVHGVYERAGFPYPYRSSAELYEGTLEFRRVVHPRTGDLVVWPGHVGIVVNPVRRVFYSALRSGRGVESYDAPYWKGRGRVRFYRYVKPAGESAGKGQRLMQTSRTEK